MAYNPKDYYFRKAKTENYAARSAFKLEEIDQRFKILKPGQKILDLGAAPGSWSQYAAKKIGNLGKVLGIDLQRITVKLPNAVFIQADLRDMRLEEVIIKHGFTPPFDVVMSDMAPKTTGIRVTDQARSLELCELALETANRFLKPRGSFIAKLFHSDDFESFRSKLRQTFEKVEVLRPKSTRKESKEIFLIGISFVEPKKSLTGDLDT
ncbi:MAG: RlmE family RNA methyltransferase [Bdellovibrionales bacterium]|nr:RlmE family RNA methyltransferase [Bdellovibrionales bacterium]